MPHYTHIAIMPCHIIHISRSKFVLPDMIELDWNKNDLARFTNAGFKMFTI